MKLSLGSRLLLGASCLKCGKWCAGSEFKYSKRNHRDRVAYIDQRCANCKWGAKLKGRM